MGAANRICADQVGAWVILLVQIAGVVCSGELDGLTAALLVGSDLAAWVVALDIITSFNVMTAMLAATIAWRYNTARPSRPTGTAQVVPVASLRWLRDRCGCGSEKRKTANDDEDGAGFVQVA